MISQVHDMDGRVVWRIRVAADELTCTICGETTADPYCPRCQDMKGQIGNGKPCGPAGVTLVPTMSYLHAEEVELI